MNYPMAELADKYTILLLKKVHGVELDEDGEDLEMYKLALDGVDLTELLGINGTMWDLEEHITIQSNLKTIGALYLALRSLSGMRIAAKNKIAAAHSEPREKKTY